MTAVNVILRREAAYVVSDGRTDFAAGGTTLPRPKVLPLPHLNAVLAARGDMTVLISLYGILCHKRATLDDAAEALGADLRDTLDQLRRLAPHPVAGPNDVALVGWPGGTELPTFHLAEDEGRYGEPPYTSRLYGGVLMPYDPGAGRLAGRNLLDVDEPFDPEADAVALIRAQSAVEGAGIGAFCQVTTVRRDRIGTKILRL